MRVDGKGCFQNSPDLKAFVTAEMANGEQFFVIDLENCTGMDSTFMGVLTCIATKLEENGGCLHVVNAAGRNGTLLRGLGLDEIFTVEDGTELVRRGICGGMKLNGEPMEMTQVPGAECSRDEHTRVCLQAHEALAEVDGANRQKFRDVIELMREALQTAGAPR